MDHVWENLNSNYEFNTISAEENALIVSNSKSPGKTKRIEFSEIDQLTSDHGSGLAFVELKGDIVTFAFQDEEQRDSCFGYLSREADFAVSESRKTPLQAASCSGCGALFVAAWTALFYFAAKDQAENPDGEITGRHQLFKKVIAWILDVIGTTGVLVLGAVLLVILVRNAVKAATNPPVEIKLVPPTS